MNFLDNILFALVLAIGIGYFTINPFLGDGESIDLQFLDSLEAVHETKFLRHVHFEKPLTIKIDGKKSLGLILKPS